MTRENRPVTHIGFAREVIDDSDEPHAEGSHSPPSSPSDAPPRKKHRSHTSYFGGSSGRRHTSDASRSKSSRSEALFSLIAHDLLDSRESAHVSSRLSAETARANDAERALAVAISKLKSHDGALARTQTELGAVRSELAMYKSALETAHAEVRRAQEVVDGLERQVVDAEERAARARDAARKWREVGLVERAREVGRREGMREGVRTGRRWWEGSADRGVLIEEDEEELAEPMVVDRRLDERQLSLEDGPSPIAVRESLIEEDRPSAQRYPSGIGNRPSRRDHTDAALHAATLPVPTLATPLAMPSPMHAPAYTPEPLVPRRSRSRSRPQQEHESYFPEQTPIVVPTPMRPRADSTASQRAHVVPPDGYIPAADSASFIALPPPNELARPVPSEPPPFMPADPTDVVPDRYPLRYPPQQDSLYVPHRSQDRNPYAQPIPPTPGAVPMSQIPSSQLSLSQFDLVTQPPAPRRERRATMDAAGGRESGAWLSGRNRSATVSGVEGQRSASAAGFREVPRPPSARDRSGSAAGFREEYVPRPPSARDRSGSAAGMREEQTPRPPSTRERSGSTTGFREDYLYSMSPHNPRRPRQAVMPAPLGTGRSTPTPSRSAPNVPSAVASAVPRHVQHAPEPHRARTTEPYVLVSTPSPPAQPRTPFQWLFRRRGAVSGDPTPPQIFIEPPSQPASTVSSSARTELHLLTPEHAENPLPAIPNIDGALQAILAETPPAFDRAAVPGAPYIPPRVPLSEPTLPETDGLRVVNELPPGFVPMRSETDYFSQGHRPLDSTLERIRADERSPSPLTNWVKKVGKSKGKGKERVRYEPAPIPLGVVYPDPGREQDMSPNRLARPISLFDE